MDGGGRRLGSDPDELVARGAERIAPRGCRSLATIGVEGWSAIGKWTGVPLGDLMHKVQPLPTAKFAVFHCADVDDEGVAYYESMALADCLPPSNAPGVVSSTAIPSMCRTARRRSVSASNGSSATSRPSM